MYTKQTTLAIDGKFISIFKSIELKESLDSHHEFEIVLDHDTIEGRGAFTLDRSTSWLGRPVVIGFEGYEFLGYVTQVKLSNQDGHEGDIIVKGSSPTILLETGLHNQSWLERDLKTIIEKATEGFNIEILINPEHREELSYVSQYKESQYNFIKRMARDFKEWMYYDGTKLIFGRPKQTKEIELVYGKDIHDIEISINTIATNYKRYGYSEEMDLSLEGESAGKLPGANELSSKAFESSKRVYGYQTRSYAPFYVKDKYNSNYDRDRLQGAKGARHHVLEGKSSYRGLSIGKLVRIKSIRMDSYFRGDKSYDQRSYGEYIITKIVHYAEGEGVYRNEFECLPGGIQILPEPEVDTPIAEPQLARVVSNEDPRGMGRVQARMSWMESSIMHTPFMRVMTPDAGSSGSHDKNRGQVFIPEVGDQVMVGFEHNDPSLPFVMGSMYHANNGKGGDIDNNIKSIITRSGHEIVFNDAKNAESITITDKKGNHFIIDTAGETITINALKDVVVNAGENLTLNSKNMQINVEENLDITVGKNKTESINENYMFSAQNEDKQIGEEIKVVSATYKQEAQEITTDASGEIKTNAGGKITIASSETVEVAE